MKLLRLELKNFKPFRDLELPEGEGELPGGLILIRGPNSTGKSSIFEGILWALWGPDAVGLTNDELVSFTSTWCKAVLVFEVAGTRYKMDRSYSSAKGMAVVLYTRTGDAWKRLANKSKSVSNELMQILNLDLQQALNTLLVRQGEVALIANATPTVLRNLIVRIYNIELLDKMSDHLKSFELDLEAQIRGLEDDYIRPEYIAEQINDTKIRIEDYERSFKSNEAEAGEIKNHLKEMPDPEGLEAIHALTQEVERIERDHNSSMRYRDSDLANAGLSSAEIEVVQARLKILKKEAKRYESSRKKLETETTEVDRELGAIDATKSDLSEKVVTLEGVSVDDDSGVAECPTCAKPLSTEERENLLVEYQQVLKQNEEKAKTLKGRRVEVSDELRGIEEHLSDISKAHDAVCRIKEKQKDVDKAEKRLEKKQAKLLDAIKKAGVADIESLLKKHGGKSVLDLQRRLDVLSTKLGEIAGQCDSFRKLIDREQDAIKELEAKSVKMSELGAEMDSLKSLNEHTKYVRLKLVNGFVADYVVQKRLLGIIKGATNEYVRAFTNNQYTGIDLVPTTARGRSGAGLALKIHDQRDDATKKATQLSFGDRTAVSLGLRLGISRTMSYIRPLRDSPSIAPRIRCVMLDEPLGGLDKSRRTSVVSNLVNDQSFEQILLITHTDIQGWDDVPAIEVSKSGSAAIAKLLM
ncbi:MAG: AAA family ATPase [Candidatus Thorarchaeota archaeon]|nr:AAA family ATPase [Candidatus Thorarchaeota archaeon]